MSNQEANYGVEAALRRHCERERNSELGMTIRALLSSDNSRLEFFDASCVVDHSDIQRRYVAGDVERVAIEASLADPELTACVGYESTSGSRPAESAWLIDGENNLIDPQHGRRQVDAFLGIQLRATEAGNWTPHQPSAVAELSVHRLAV